MKLGSLHLKNNLILSPLLNVTSPVYRRFCRHFTEIGLVCVPMLYAKRLQTRPKSPEFELQKIEQESPISVQIVGKDEEAIKESVIYLESYEFDVLDLNAGCPSKRAIHGKYGGYLLSDLDKLNRLINLMTKYSSKPVSVKVRTGFNKELEVKEFLNLINETNMDFLTVHARTVKDRFNESTINLDFLKNLKKSTDIPIVGNGDIFTPESAKQFLDKTNVDALMIGRGSMGNPEIFRYVKDYITNNRDTSLENNRELMRSYIEIFEKILEDFLDGIDISYSKYDYRFVELKRNAIWLTKNIENSTTIRKKLGESKTLKQLKTFLEEYLK
ncbi:MAG: tRNA dihydrouridine synthase [Candidatus Hermodarchaeota archaeon]